MSLKGRAFSDRFAKVFLHFQKILHPNLSGKGQSSVISILEAISLVIVAD